MSHPSAPAGPDLSSGVDADSLKTDQPLLGHVGQDEVVLVRHAGEIFAVGATCTHYHGPLVKGLVAGGGIRCPWHHACFSLRNGEVLAPPALNPIPCWRIEQRAGKVYVREKFPPLVHSNRSPMRQVEPPASVLIVGGGAAGEAAAVTLRFCDYRGPVTLVSAEDNLPCDRPNLSKDYLAGTAPEEWVPLRSESFYQEKRITLLRNLRATAIDVVQRKLRLEDGRELGYAALLLATGAEPIHLTLPGADLPHVHYLRSVSDSRSIIAAVEQGARRAVVIGASFIGLEVAASLRTRGAEVHVVAPEARPMERIFGPRLGDFIRALHESKGVVFHLGQSVTAIRPEQVMLKGEGQLAADLVVVGVGVRPLTALAEQAGLKINRGVLVNEYLETSAPGIYAAGDIARWPDAMSGLSIRVEHWAVAQHQGQVAARNILGYRERYTAVPFFWSQHYDISLNYVGHAEQWDSIDMQGDPEKSDCAFTYKQAGRVLALATIFRDRHSLEMEVRMEQLAADA